MNNIDNHIRIFDTTLRDGEQCPGASMTQDEKMRVAKMLEAMKVDIIEAGFPIASSGDFASVQAIASEVKESVICALARATRKDIERAAEALRPARFGRIHTFISTSALHMKHKLGMDGDAVLDAITDSVTLARHKTDDVEWSPEDASRSEHDFLCQAVERAIAAGATTINIPDTVGYSTPAEFGALIAMLRERVSNSDKAIFSAHCHNDLGLAVANSYAAIAAGARQVECTINGIGERAGNASLEELVMLLKTRRDLTAWDTAIDTSLITRASRLVSQVTGFTVQPNKAIVGANAFAHEAGIHQDGMLKHSETYEIMTPESVGLSESQLVLGKHSGRHAFRSKLKDLGYEELNDDQLDDAFSRFKNLADHKKIVFEEDIIALVDDEMTRRQIAWHVVSLDEVVALHQGRYRVAVTVSLEGELKTASLEADGVVESLFSCCEKACGKTAQLELYQVKAVTRGRDAQAEVVVQLKDGNRRANGHGTDADTLLASVRAYVQALARLYHVPSRADSSESVHVAAI